MVKQIKAKVARYAGERLHVEIPKNNREDFQPGQDVIIKKVKDGKKKKEVNIV